MEMTTDGSRGFKTDHEKYDLEITTINRMIEEFCSDLFCPEILLKIPKNEKEFGFDYVKRYTEFILALTNMYIIDNPLSYSFKEYYRMRCTVKIYSLKNYPNATDADILAGLGTRKFGCPDLEYMQTFYIDKNELFNNGRVVFCQVARDYIAGGAHISGPRREFIDNLIKWSNDYLYDKTQQYLAEKQLLKGEKNHPESDTEASEIIYIQTTSDPSSKPEILSKEKLEGFFSEEGALKYLKEIDIDKFLEVVGTALNYQIHSLSIKEDIRAGKNNLTPPDLFDILKIVKEPNKFTVIRKEQ